MERFLFRNKTRARLGEREVVCILLPWKHVKEVFIEVSLIHMIKLIFSIPQDFMFECLDEFTTNSPNLLRDNPSLPRTNKSLPIFHRTRLHF